jgi:hypothetical protein
MRGNSQIFQRKLVEPTTKFLEQAMEAYIPANLVIFIDTHSDANTGYLQYSGGKSGGNSAAIDEVSPLSISPNDQMITDCPSSYCASSLVRSSLNL